MRFFATVVPLLCVALFASCQSETPKATLGGTSLVNQTVEASCGQCQLGLEGTGCDLAVRIDGKAYYVDGSSIDDHGDAHGKDGLCNCVRQAKVSGEIKDGRFQATSFKVLPKDD